MSIEMYSIANADKVFGDVKNNIRLQSEWIHENSKFLLRIVSQEENDYVLVTPFDSTCQSITIQYKKLSPQKNNEDDFQKRIRHFTRIHKKEKNTVLIFLDKKKGSMNTYTMEKRA